MWSASDRDDGGTGPHADPSRGEAWTAEYECSACESRCRVAPGPGWTRALRIWAWRHAGHAGTLRRLVHEDRDDRDEPSRGLASRGLGTRWAELLIVQAAG